ncbi:MAG: lysoplasmalogenase [Lachnospiraceae bacterium]|nr:lysoplasmalogenase [Lachnospiraceae bacterium]
MKYLAVALIGMVLQAVFITMEWKQKSIPAVIFKGLASCMFILLGVLGMGLCSDVSFAEMIVCGLICGGIGDVLLNLRFVFTKVGQKIFLAGIAAFLIGHIIYFAALVPKSQYLAVSIVIGVIVTIVLLKWMFSRIEAQKAFMIFGVLYIGAIVLMTVTSAGIAFGDPALGTIMYFIGAVAFLISDIVLIFNTFGKNQRFRMRIVNLSAYYLGQLLIALSIQLL